MEQVFRNESRHTPTRPSRAQRFPSCVGTINGPSKCVLSVCFGLSDAAPPSAFMPHARFMRDLDVASWFRGKALEQAGHANTLFIPSDLNSACPHLPLDRAEVAETLVESGRLPRNSSRACLSRSNLIADVARTTGKVQKAKHHHVRRQCLMYHVFDGVPGKLSCALSSLQACPFRWLV